MLLGHWYLVQPGLAREPLLELVRWTGADLAARGRRAAVARPGWCRCSTAPSTTATTACSAGSGWPARSPRSGWSSSPGPRCGAALLGGDGGDRPALPGDPHGVRHRSGGARRAGRLIARVAGAVRRGGRTGARLGEAARPPVRRPGPSSCGGAVLKRSAAITLCVETLRNCNEGLAPACSHLRKCCAGRGVSVLPSPCDHRSCPRSVRRARSPRRSGRSRSPWRTRCPEPSPRRWSTSAIGSASTGRWPTPASRSPPRSWPTRTGLVERWVREWAYNQAARPAWSTPTTGGGGRALLAVARGRAGAGRRDARDEPASACSTSSRRRMALLEALPESFRTGIGHDYDTLGPEARGRRRARLRAVDAQPPGRRSCCPGLDGVVDAADRRRGRGRRRLRRRRRRCSAGAGVPRQPVPRLRHLAVRPRPGRASSLAASGLANAAFHDPRDEPLPADGSLGFVTTFDCLHDMTDPDGIAGAIRAALADDGTWLVADIKAHDTYAENVEKNPMAALMYGTSVLTLHVVRAVRARRRRPRHARPVRRTGPGDGPRPPASPASARSTSTTRSTPSTRSAPDAI